MTRQRAIVAMLAVFCVLLALNLIKGEPEAQAEPQSREGIAGACCVNGEFCFNVANAAECAAFGGTYFAGLVCTDPNVFLNCTPPPTVVAGAVRPVSSLTDRVYRFWSDGEVDESTRRYQSDNSCNISSSCGPVSVIPLP